MKRITALLMLTLPLAVTGGQASSSPSELAGTSWQLVQFRGSDGQALAPDNATNYTVAFSADGVVNVRFDCNRGRGGWKSAGKSRIEFGPMALTRAACPPGSLHDSLVKHWDYIRSYLLRDGHLYLSLMADGGTYEFAPTK